MKGETPMSDLIEITDDDRERLRDAARFVESRTRNSVIAGDLRELAARKPVGDGEAVLRLTREVVLRLTREEAQELVDLAELPIEETSWGTRVRTPLGDKLRTALDQGGSDE